MTAMVNMLFATVAQAAATVNGNARSLISQ
jgi:hypothetical protein